MWAFAFAYQPLSSYDRTLVTQCPTVTVYSYSSAYPSNQITPNKNDLIGCPRRPLHLLSLLSKPSYRLFQSHPPTHIAVSNSHQTDSETSVSRPLLTYLPLSSKNPSSLGQKKEKNSSTATSSSPSSTDHLIFGTLRSGTTLQLRG